MNYLSNKSFKIYHQFIFRLPLISLVDSIIKITELFNISKQSNFKESIFLASPVLYDELIKWHKNELKDQEGIKKLEISLYKYYSRMQSRCTPYGLFAGCGTGEWGNNSEIKLDGEIKRNTRLDMNFLCALAQQLSRNPSLLPYLKFYPNNSLYSNGRQLRYVEYKYIKNRRLYEISGVDNSDYINLILEKSTEGCTINEFAILLVGDGINYEDAEEFINELIQNQILVSELEPTVTGNEFIYQILDTLEKINAKNGNTEIEEIIDVLKLTDENINAIDKKIGNDVEAYRNIYQNLKVLNTPIEENQLFQTDLYKSATIATLATNVQLELYETINFLNKLYAGEESSNLKNFKGNFLSQYEDSEIPLLHLLDTETGIGYIGKDTNGVNQLLDGLFLKALGQNEKNLKWNNCQALLNDKLLQAIKTDAYTITFADEDIKDIKNETKSLPDSLAIRFRYINETKILLDECGGSSAANLLGRFAHGDDKILEIIKDITTHEQNLNQDKILAEIVHLPENRIGNILLRPVFREYEIPYLGKSAVPTENQIPLEDLMVSIKNNKIILRSKKLNKEIIPRLSTAHNFSFNALPAYQFLCEMQTQYFEKSGLGFNWGVLSNTYKFLPRAEYKNVILSRAKWQFSKEDFKVLLENEKSKNNNEITAWREKWNIPKLVVLADGDNELMINFEDELSIKMLVSAIKNKDRIILEEFLFDVNNLLIKDKDGNGYTNEIIAVLLRNKEEEEIISPPKNITLQNQTNSIAVQQDFIIGSEWLYYKLYCGIKTAEKLLIESIKPMVDEWLKYGLIDKFFFIRYSDPDFHLRLRFHTNNREYIGKLVTMINLNLQPYVEQRLVSKVQTDTYKRELARYGTNSMEFSESLFYLDSITTINVLSLFNGEKGDEIRWQFALRSIDELLNCFSYSFSGKIKLLETLKTNFANEHGGGKDLKVLLDTKFRKLRREVEVILKDNLEQTRSSIPFMNILTWKNEQLKPISEKILQLKNLNELEVPLDDLLSSYLHMMMNRIFKSRQRTCEMVVYDLLFKYYKSIEAREKHNKK